MTFPLMPMASVYQNRLSVEYTSGQVSTADRSTYTFAAVPLGTPSADREIMVVTANNNNSGPNVIGATVAGVSASIYSATSGSPGRFSLISAKVPTGTSGDIVINLSQTSTAITACVFAVTGRRMYGAAPYSSQNYGTTYVTSYNIPVYMPINSVAMYAGIAIGGSTPNVSVNSPFIKLNRTSGSGWELYSGYLLPKVEATSTVAFSGSYGSTFALGGGMFVIE